MKVKSRCCEFVWEMTSLMNSRLAFPVSNNLTASKPIQDQLGKTYKMKTPKPLAA
jgi:hypothetical protein